METLAPLTVAVPMVIAGIIGGVGHFLPRRVPDLLAIGAAAATATMSTILVVASETPMTYYFGGWKPSNGIQLGIVFFVDPLAASIAALAGTLATASLVASWRYFEEVGPLYHVLFLVFLGGMIGFTLSGDVFNMFVWFELMGAAAFTLTGYRIDEPGPLQGALVFAILNSLAAFLILGGIALLYGRAGALNLAQIGHVLSSRPPDGLVIVAFVLLLVGFLTKAGAVPFHFWLSDAYAVAPVPVCVLLSGVMSDLGLHGIIRVFWPVFSEPFAGHAEAVRAILVGVGVLTALVGAAMAFLQAQLKRLLAFVTISHVGIFLSGAGLLTATGLAGMTIYVVADGLAKGALFLLVAVLVTELGDANELRLHGRGRRLVVTAVLFAVGVLALAQLPPFGTFLGLSLVIDSALALGWSWLPPLLTVAAAIAAGAVARAGARIFLGLGTADDPLLTQQPERGSEEEPESPGGRRRHASLLFVPAGALLAASLGLAFAPGLAEHAVAAAAQFENPASHVRSVLRGEHVPPPHVPAPSLSVAAWAYGSATVVGALAVTLLGLYRPRLAGRAAGISERILGPAAAGLRRIHSGAIGDYVTWLTVGAAVLGGLFAVTLT